MTTTTLDEMAAKLLASGEYRVQKRLGPQPAVSELDLPDGYRIAVALDTETTGTDERDRIIELGMVAFAYCPVSFEIYGVTATFNALEDPGMPIPPEASAVNKITDDMVAGHKFDDRAIEQFVADAEFIVAHNAGFDRTFCERRFPFFSRKSWACSWREIDWQAHGASNGKLEQVAAFQGFFFDAHRAEVDCLALVTALKFVPESGVPVLSELIGNSQAESRRIWAVNSPFAAKELLKARGYRWSDGTREGAEKAWLVEVPLSAFEEELSFLRESVFRNGLGVIVDKVDSMSRYSARRAGTHRVMA